MRVERNPGMWNCMCQHHPCYAFFKPDSTEKNHEWCISLATSAWWVSAPVSLSLPTCRMGMPLHWQSQRWRGNLAVVRGRGVLSKCRTRCSPRSGQAERSKRETKVCPYPGAGRLQSSRWLVKSTSPAALGPQRPAGALSAIQPGTAWQPPSYYTIEFEESPTRFQFDSWHPLDSLIPRSPQGLLLWALG